MANVIVFGPTGSVASIAARTAKEQGAKKVVLAMRDPQKKIPGLELDAEQERQQGFERIQADLMDAESVSAAVRNSGATRAFFYLAYGSPDQMKSTIQAMKAGGIDFIVFLSSYTITGEAKDVQPEEFIAYVHAQVELTLDDVYGSENYVALRPGGFATNFLRYKKELNEGEVKLHGPNFTFDGITPGDMGRVAGTILVHGSKNSQRKVYLFGPQVLSQKDGIETLAKVLGRNITITSLTGDEALQGFVRAGIPKKGAEYMVQNMEHPVDDNLRRPKYEEGVANVELYTGKPSMPFEQWVGENKGLFTDS